MLSSLSIFYEGTKMPAGAPMLATVTHMALGRDREQGAASVMVSQIPLCLPHRESLAKHLPLKSKSGGKALQTSQKHRMQKLRPRGKPCH